MESINLVKNVLRKHFGGVVVWPSQGMNDYDVFKVVLIRDVDPEHWGPTNGPIQQLLGSDSAVLKTTEPTRPVNQSWTIEPERDGFAGVGAGPAKLGVTGESVGSLKVNVSQRSTLSVVNANDLLGLIKHNACNMASNIMELNSEFGDGTGMENGFTEIAVGFVYEVTTGVVTTQSVQHAHGSVGAQATVVGDASDIPVLNKLPKAKVKLGVGGKKQQTEAYEGDPVEPIAAKLMVVLLRHYDLEKEVRLVRGPFPVTGAEHDNRKLKELLRQSMARLEKLKEPKPPSVFRRLMAPVFMLGKKNETETAEAQRARLLDDWDDDNGYRELVLTSGTELLDVDRVGPTFYSSWHSLVRVTKAEVKEFLEGELFIGGVKIDDMDVVHEMDIGGFVPIYYNPKTNPTNEEVPSSVLCYDTGTEGVWCLRPVENVPKNNKVVTIENREWRVRKSIVRVRSEDIGFQDKLKLIGFHILEEGSDVDYLKEPDAAAGELVVMGRHELTPFHSLGTTLDEIEYCPAGYVREREETNGDSKISAPASVPSLTGTHSESSAPGN